MPFGCTDCYPNLHPVSRRKSGNSNIVNDLWRGPRPLRVGKKTWNYLWSCNSNPVGWQLGSLVNSQNSELAPKDKVMSDNIPFGVRRQLIVDVPVNPRDIMDMYIDDIINSLLFQPWRYRYCHQTWDCYLHYCSSPPLQDTWGWDHPQGRNDSLSQIILWSRSWKNTKWYKVYVLISS